MVDQGSARKSLYISSTKYVDKRDFYILPEDDDAQDHQEEQEETNVEALSTMPNLDTGGTLDGSTDDLLLEIEDLQQRLDQVNRQFRRKASEVLIDESALHLLADLYKDVVLNLEGLDLERDGLPLAKLTAAHFAEVGAKVICITEAGQRFMESIRDA